MMYSESLGAYIKLTRFDRPIGTFLLLWPTLWALWLAGHGDPDSTMVLIFAAGAVLMRAAGCIINDYADRELDTRVQRTKDRPLASGVLSGRQALSLFAVLMLLAFGLALLLNRLALYLSFIAAALAVVYPFSKRVISLPQCVLGLAFSMSIPMVYAATTGALPVEAWILFFANFLWTTAYDTQYAMTDREDDLAIGIKSSAILFGRYDNMMVGLLHAGAFLIIGFIGREQGASWHFYLFLAAAAGFALYQQFLCKDRIPANCLKAFLNNNWVGAMIFCGLLLGIG